jgi:hypothetical protein
MSCLPKVDRSVSVGTSQLVFNPSMSRDMVVMDEHVLGNEKHEKLVIVELWTPHRRKADTNLSEMQSGKSARPARQG